MIFKFLLFLILNQKVFGFYYEISDFLESDELNIVKSLDIEPEFLCDEKYNNLKQNISQLDIHFFIKAIEDSPSIFHTLKDIVQKSNVPDNFLYMAMIESKFLISAKSNKNARGLWQFMPQTAKLLKLKHTSMIDERLDPIKSTKAAIKYLKYLHERFQKWYLAALAYNCGETRLAKAIRESGSDDLFVLLDDTKKYIPKETKNYIRRLLIASLISHHKKVNETINKYKKNIIILSPIKIKEQETLEDIAKRYDTKYDQLKKYNAHILKDIVPKNNYIYLPKKSIWKAKNIDTRIYTTRKNTTLLTLSKKFHLNPTKLKILNKKISIFIPKNTKIALPKNTKLIKNKLKFKRLKNIKNSSNNNDTYEYKIAKGDTLFTISQKSNNKISTIKKLNKHIGYDLKIGTVIKLKR